MKKYRRSDWQEPPAHEEASDERSSLAGRIFHWFMIGLSLAIVFAISGGLFYLKAMDRGVRDMDGTALTAFIKFSIGGSLGVGLVLWFYFRKPRHII